MHPQLFLKTFWRIELRPQVFVAMSFSPNYSSRFKDIIAPTISTITVNGINLEPYRVDLSKSGDSILTDIMDGIAHAQMVLADVSSAGKESVSGEPCRNGKVMYEVGLALACRHSSEILLIRDAKDSFLFDVSTIPHMHIDFSDVESAKGLLTAALSDRLREQKHINDARVQLAVASLSTEEAHILKQMTKLSAGQSWGRPSRSMRDFVINAPIPRLIEKQLIRVFGAAEQEYLTYELTPLGNIVAGIISSLLTPQQPFSQPADQNQTEG